MTMPHYKIPAATARAEYEINRSRFIATLGNVETVDAARAFIASVRTEFADASSQAYAFKVGYGPSVTEGSSDGGEPSGTAGPPILAVLRGAEIGDSVLVVTRYFGGIKLGTGGLVRAFSDAARSVLAVVTTREKIELRHLGLTLPYALYERIKLIAADYQATIEAEEFAAEVTLYLVLPLEAVDAFTLAIRDLSAGKVTPTVLDS